MSLLIHIEDLLSGKIVEGTRMELKKSWNPEVILRTVCAFANDFENEGSGYIVVGVEDNDGKPVRPVFGFDPNDLEKVEKELLNYCNQIQPSYFPRISLEEIDNKNVLVIIIMSFTIFTFSFTWNIKTWLLFYTSIKFAFFTFNINHIIFCMLGTI